MVGSLPLGSQGCPPHPGEEGGRGKVEQGGVTGLLHPQLEQAHLLGLGVNLVVLHLDDLLPCPCHLVQVGLPSVPHDHLGLLHLIQPMGRNIFLCLE